MDLDKLYPFLEHVGTFSILIPILMCIYKFKALNIQLWALFIYMLFCIITDRLSLYYLREEEKINILMNCFTVLELCFFLFIYSREVNERKIKTLMFITAGLILLFSLIVFIKRYKLNDSLLTTMEATLMIIIASLYFLQSAFETKVPSNKGEYFFWINLGVLIYFSAAFFLFLSGDFLQNCSLTLARLLWSIHALVGISSNILFSYGIWKKNTK